MANTETTTKTTVTTLGQFKTKEEADRVLDTLANTFGAKWELHSYSEFRDSLNHVHGPTVLIENTTTHEPATIIYCADEKQANRLFDILRDVLDIKFEW